MIKYMRRALLGSFWALAGLVSLPATATPAPDTGKSTFHSGDRAVTEIKVGEFKDLQVRCSIPSGESAKDWDLAKVMIKPDHWKGSASAYRYTKDGLLSRVKDGSINLTILEKDGKTGQLDLGRSGNWKYLTEFPRQSRLAKITLSVWVKVYKKTGEREEVHYDKARRVWIKNRIPIYDRGRLISEGSLVIHQLPARNVLKDPMGVFQVKLVQPDLEYKFVDEKVNGLAYKGVRIRFPAGKNQFGQKVYIWIYYCHVSIKELKEKMGHKMGGQDAMSFLKNDLQSSLFWTGRRPAMDWKNLLNRPSYHDFRSFKPLWKGWKSETLGSIEWQQMGGIQQRRPLLGSFAFHQSGDRILISSTWLSGDVLRQGNEAIQKYAKPIDETSKSLHLLKR